MKKRVIGRNEKRQKRKCKEEEKENHVVKDPPLWR